MLSESALRGCSGGGEARFSRVPPPVIPFTTVLTSSQALKYCVCVCVCGVCVVCVVCVCVCGVCVWCVCGVCGRGEEKGDFKMKVELRY